MDEIYRKVARMGKDKALQFAIEWARSQKLARTDARYGHISSKPRSSKSLEEDVITILVAFFDSGKAAEYADKEVL